MMTREECFNALEHLKKWVCADNVDDMVVFRQLINEHFDPEPYKFEDLKEGMYVYVESVGDIYRIEDILDEENIKAYGTQRNGYSCLEYCEDEFYPVQKANDRMCYE